MSDMCGGSLHFWDSKYGRDPRQHKFNRIFRCVQMLFFAGGTDPFHYQTVCWSFP
jgi:hypothetical protein